MSIGEDKGFTLIEFLLVIAILGILAGMSGPMIGGSLFRWRVDQFSRSVLTTHQAARFHAITNKTQIQVRYFIDQDKIEFYVCEDLDSGGSCTDWQPFTTMPTLRTPNKDVQFGSVGDKTSGEACSYYKPNGQVAGPYNRDNASGEECPGSDPTGSGIHVTRVPRPDVSDESNHCKWNTIYHPASTGKSTLLDYGAYGLFDHTAGNEPPCAS